MDSSRSLAGSLLTPAQRAAGVKLPDRDIRTALDDAVRRGWSENTRRAARVLALLALDTIAGLIGVAIALETWGLVSNQGLRPLPNPVPLIAMVCCLQPLALRVTGAYGGGKSRVSLERIVGGVALAALVGWLQAHLFGQMTRDLPNKTAFVYSAALIAICIWLGRLAFDLTVRAGFRAGVLQRRVLLIGHRDDVENVQRRIDHRAASDVHVVAALSPDQLTESAECLDEAVRTSGAHAVVVAANLPFELLERILVRCHRSGVSVSLLPRSLQNLGASYFELRESAAGPLLQVMPLRFGFPQLAVKRTMDVALTFLALAILWPVLLIVAAAIKFDSAGPVLFRQVRVGVGGRPFHILKFRTMVIDAEEQKKRLLHMNAYPDQRLFKIKNDPRITRVGRFLRRSSLDELPQLWNVLKGEMSLVGPRPCVPGELEHYGASHFERLFVLPGVTGPWQVNGRNDVGDFEAVVRLERDYIESWSIRTDVLILLKTLPALLGHGAY